MRRKECDEYKSNEKIKIRCKNLKCMYLVYLATICIRNNNLIIIMIMIKDLTFQH